MAEHFSGGGRRLFPVRVRLRGLELKVKCFEAGQHEEESDHCLG